MTRTSALNGPSGTYSRPSAPSVCGLKLLVDEALPPSVSGLKLLVYQALATSVSGLKLLVYEALSY